MSDAPRSAVALLTRAIVRHRRQLPLSYGLLTSWQICESLVPVLIGVIIDRSVVDGDLAEFGFWCATLCLLFVALSYSYRWGAGIGFRAMQEETHLLRVETASHVLHPRGARTGLLPGETLSLATSDAEIVGSVVYHVGYTFAALLSVLFAAVMLLRIDLTIALVVLVGVPLVVIATQAVTPLIARRTDRQQEAIARATGLATDFVQGLRPLKGTGGEDAAVDRYREASHTAYEASIRTAWSWGYLLGLSSGLSGLFLAIVAMITGVAAVEGRIGIGEFIAIVGLTQFLAEPIRAIGEVGAQGASAYASSRRIVTFLHSPRLRDEGGLDVSGEPQLRLTSVAAGPLRDLTLQMHPGEMLVVAVDDPAASDALVSLLRGERTVEAGTARLGDIDLHDLTVESLRTHVLVSEHRVDLFEGSLRSNIDPDERLGPDAWTAVLGASAANDVIALHPDGLDQPMRAGGSTLSGGQRQRVALARGLAATAPLLVLQEPTTAVDAVTEHRIARGLRALRHDGSSTTATLVISSSPVMLDQADRVVLVVDGRVVADGTHRELLADATYREAVLR